MRLFVLVLLAMAAFTAHAQSAAKPWRLGMLTVNERASAAPSPIYSAFLQELRRLGYRVLCSQARSFTAHRHEIADEAEEGGLIAYGPKLEEMFRRAALYVDRVLKGARPAEMPIEHPTQFELVLNRRTATGLGLNVPPSILARADRVID